VPAPDVATGGSTTAVATPDRAHQLELAGIVTGGAGVVLAGVGGFFLWRGSALKSDINSEIGRTHAWSAALTSKDADRKTANTLGAVCLITGGAAVAAGVVLYAVGWNKAPHEGGSASALLTPVVAPGAGGLLVSGRF
jgi:hypothetical protein